MKQSAVNLRNIFGDDFGIYYEVMEFIRTEKRMTVLIDPGDRNSVKVIGNEIERLILSEPQGLNILLVVHNPIYCDAIERRIYSYLEKYQPKIIQSKRIIHVLTSRIDMIYAEKKDDVLRIAGREWDPAPLQLLKQASVSSSSYEQNPAVPRSPAVKYLQADKQSAPRNPPSSRSPIP